VESVRALTRADLVALHRARFVPGNTTIAVTGDVDPEKVTALMNRLCAGWRGAATTVETPSAAPDAPPAITVVDWPRASQSFVRIVAPAPPRTSADFAAMSVLNEVLGGQFSSRLMMNLREKRAYSYGIWSVYEWRRGASPWRAGGAVRKDVTAESVHEILAELARVQSEPVEEAELADAKVHLLRHLPATLTTDAEVASWLADTASFELPLGELKDRMARIEAVTAADMQRVARESLDRARLRIVVVGDAAVVAKPLAALGVGDVRVIHAAADARPRY
jgi:predicted Zn-dependent peptidase